MAEKKKVDTYCGCDIYKGHPYPPDTYWSPCVAGAYKKKKAVKRRIEKAGYCRKGTKRGPEAPKGIHRSFLGFEGKIRDRIKEARFIVSTELRLYGRARFPIEVIVKLAENSENWSEDECSWWFGQPKIEDIIVGRVKLEVTETEDWFTIPLDLDKIVDVENLSLALLVREEKPDNYCYARDREAREGAYSPRISIKHIKVA